jgi:hypothetical protein
LVVGFWFLVFGFWWLWVVLEKSEPTVISRGFFHQSKNEQLCYVTVVAIIWFVVKCTSC